MASSVGISHFTNSRKNGYKKNGLSAANCGIVWVNER